MLILNTDCRFYIGEKPCRHGRLCDGCPHYEPWKGVILIIKTAAMGDVLRTTSLLPALSRKYPGWKITWLAGVKSAALLRNHPLIDEVIVFDHLACHSLLPREFDLLISLDKTPAEAGLAMLISAAEEKGIGLSSHGAPFPLNSETEYYFELGISDELKFRRNRKTYHELIHEVCGLEAINEPPSIHLTDDEKERSGKIVKKLCGQGCKKIGLVAGAAATYANKSPDPAWWNRLIEILASKTGIDKSEIFLLGGPDDRHKITEVSGAAGHVHVLIENEVRLFAGFISMMDAIVCGDTLALHIATALGTPAVTLFGPTCEAEIDLFSKGSKVVSTMDCVPCYKGKCVKKPNCMDMIEPDKVAALLYDCMK